MIERQKDSSQRKIRNYTNMQEQSIGDNTLRGALWKTKSRIVNVSLSGALVLIGDHYHLTQRMVRATEGGQGPNGDKRAPAIIGEPTRAARPGRAPPSADLRRVLERPHAVTALGALPPAPAPPRGRLGLAAGLRLPGLLSRASGSG